MPQSEQLIDIKEVADTFGKSVESIRKYKNFGILKISEKRGNKDLFDREEILKVRDRLHDLRLKGLSLSQIADQLDQARGREMIVADPLHPSSSASGVADQPVEVLIAVEEAGVRAALIGFLQDHGYVVWEAGDGEEALAVIFSRKPGLILLDFRLPKVDGYQVCRILKGNAATSWIPIIILTAPGTTAEKLKGTELGADDYINKPFDLEELLGRIKMFTRRVYVG